MNITSILGNICFDKRYVLQHILDYVSVNPISDGDLSKLCDYVENVLEEIVIQFRGHFFEEGMEDKLRAQYESRLSIMIAKKGGSFEKLSHKQQKLVQNRISLALELFKKEYES